VTDVTTSSDLVLAGEFDPATREEWLAAVAKALRGGDFERILVGRTLDGVRIEPLYTADDVAVEGDEGGFPGFSPLLRGQQAPSRPDGAWDIRVTVANPDPARANAQALADLRGGATSLDLVVDVGGSGHGVSCRSAEDLGRAIDGVLLDVAPVSLRAGAFGAVAAGWLTALWAERDVDAATVSGCLGIDPLAALASDGVLPQGVDAAFADAARYAREVSAAAPHVRAVRASGLPAFDAGASEGQEIGFVLGSATASLRALVDGGLDVSTAASQIALEIAADVDLFSTIAKLRALRHCWTVVLQESGVTVEGATSGLVRVEAVAGGRWLTQVDPWVNLLRATTATAGAVFGGADAVIVEPFDTAVGLGGDLGRRMARNTQLLLQDESGLGRVTDPAGGSYYVEVLTDQLAAVGWAAFQRYEAAGGLAAALTSGLVADEIGETARERAARIATRKHPLTGVSEFPLIGERRPDAVAAPPPDPRPGVTLAGEPTTAPPLVRRRLSQAFEDVRASAEASSLTVFLANVGTGPSYVARSTFGGNLFGAGGVRAVGEGGYADAAAAAAAFAASGAPVAVICGTDDAYAESGAQYARALKAAGAQYVYLAGRPGDREAEYRDAGVDEFVSLGADVLAVHTRLHDLLGV
jgi:methylmalonyl-CoA mutase